MTKIIEEQEKRKKILEAIMGRKPKEAHLSGCQCSICKGDPQKIARLVKGIDSKGKLATKEERQEICDAMNEICPKCKCTVAFCQCSKDK